MKAAEVRERLGGKLVVSCQADPQDAFYGMMDRFALAAVAGGAGGIRANGVDDVRAIRRAVGVPIVGIQKVLHEDGVILITPSFESAARLVDAGADMIALDCTVRGQRTGALERLRRIRDELGVAVLADIATVEEAVAAVEAGADFVLSTMRGYTAETASVRAFEPSFVSSLVRAVPVPVMAEGRIDAPGKAAEAIRRGALCVIVGSTITRPHLVSREFADAVAQAAAHVARPRKMVGIDLGGTATKFGIVCERDGLLWHGVAPTPAKAGRIALMNALQEATGATLKQARAQGLDVDAVGIATAGWVDPATGRVAYATENLPGWTGTPIADEVGAATGLPVFVENDANALAAAEKVFGSAKAFGDFVCVTLGTGVGGGVYAGGRLNRGAHFFANAIGHISIDADGRPCNCGQRGCLETYANAPALVEYAGGAYADPEAVIVAANAGEREAVAAVRRLARALAQGCSIVVQLFDPEALIVAGGLVQNNPLLVAALEEELSGKVSVWRERGLQVRGSELGYHAGVLGGAAIALEATGVS